MKMKNTIGLISALFSLCFIEVATADTHYVNIANTSPSAPYTSWATAANDIEVAVEATVAGDTVLVADGTYVLTSSIRVDEDILVRSVNGALSTIIDGNGSHNGFSLWPYDPSPTFRGFTIQNCHTGIDDGGSSVIENCIIRNNTYSGVEGGIVRNCAIYGNTTPGSGGGLNNSEAYNCTITGNHSKGYGGGAYLGSFYNCIIWGNTADGVSNDVYQGTQMYSCSPDISHGVAGNITNAPLLVSFSHIASNSPCWEAGNNTFSSGTDIDGQAWLNPPSMGCDEHAGAGSINGTISMSLNGPLVIQTGVSASYLAVFDGPVTSTSVDLGDGNVIQNPMESFEKTWAATGNVDLVLMAYNDSYPSGLVFTQTVQVVDATVYVSDDTGDDAFDGSSWSSAKKTIQAAVDAQTVYGGRVLVTNGTYMLAATIDVDKPLTVESVSGAEETIIDGSNTVNCLNLRDHAITVEGFTIQNGASGSGGGIFCSSALPLLKHCIIRNNLASSGYGGGGYNGTYRNCLIEGNEARDEGGGLYSGIAENCVINGNISRTGGGMKGGVAKNCSILNNHALSTGGGARESTLENCFVSGNSAVSSGGGVSGGTANNCTITANRSDGRGGGIASATANNCIIWHNITGGSIGGDSLSGTLRFSCFPSATHGTDGNITNAPLLVSASHISSNSPCIGTGEATYSAGTDIDGEAWGNPPSMGCDEYTGSVTGEIACGLLGPSVIGSGFETDYTPLFDGAVTETVVDFGDGVRITNAIGSLHKGWDAGTYDVVLTAFNDSYPVGISYTQTIQVVDATIYVSGASGNDTNNGLSWATAKQTIQAGVDAQQVYGGMVLVTNGTYALTSEIMVTNALVVKSVNGAGVTTVDGGSSVRCFNLADSDCRIVGFTVQNGYTTSTGGGVYCLNSVPELSYCTVTNNRSRYAGGMERGTASHCIFTGNRALAIGYWSGSYYYSSGGRGGAMQYTLAEDCEIIGNTSAEYGGGMYNGSANNCIINGNTASKYGGGIYSGTANNCEIKGNTANQYGGGIYSGTANNCEIKGNTANQYGGGIYSGTANNCVIRDNTAVSGGGGYNATVNNSSIHGNSATGNGGGLYNGTANNCTITRNSAVSSGGGMYSGTANNCIIWYNSSESLWSDSYSGTRRFSCSPDVEDGIDGNITDVPQLLSSTYLALSSPCRGAGSADYASGADIDGEAWLSLPSIGCDEYGGAGSLTGEVVVALEGPTPLMEGFDTEYMPSFDGAVAWTTIDFGDGQITTNPAPALQKSWNAIGIYEVVVTAYNDEYSSGIAYTQSVEVADAVIHVAHDTGADANDGLSWASPKKSIQAGIDAQLLFGGSVLVSNGTYVLASEITIDKTIQLQSLTGYETTIIDGSNTVRCLNLGSSDCVVSGFTIQNGKTSGNGGGIYCQNLNPIISNCIITTNEAGTGGGIYNGTVSYCLISENIANGNGGGAYQGLLNNCIVSHNSANTGGGMYNSTANNCAVYGNEVSYSAGGMYSGTANNCTIAANRAVNYGGMFSGTANNCIIWHNFAEEQWHDSYAGTRNNSCSPDIIHGDNGNITNAPLLVTATHLSQYSPCIGAGDAAYSSGFDIDAEAWGSSPSMGCDEYFPSTPANGPLSTAVAGESSLWIDYGSVYSAVVGGRATHTVLDFGDGTILTNAVGFFEKSWPVTGTYDVVLTAYNDDNPSGVSATQTVVVSDSIIYVSTSGNDSNDGLAWGSAKKTIQAGIDAQLALNGLVKVGNGTFNLTSEILVDKTIRIESQNGPAATIVHGGGVTRCFNLGESDCIVSGFTIRNGFNSSYGGGVLCTELTPVVTNCIIRDCVTTSSGGGGGGMHKGTAIDCEISYNEAHNGGGLYYSRCIRSTVSNNTGERWGGGLYECDAEDSIISDNVLTDPYSVSYDWLGRPQYQGGEGGGLYEGSASHCTISGNSVLNQGGGAYGTTLAHCAVKNNSAREGGGVFGGSASQCFISGNAVSHDGGGVSGGTANQCIISGNTASQDGGGTRWGTVNHCVITDNSAGEEGGGAYGGIIRNSIIWYNSAPQSNDISIVTSYSFPFTSYTRAYYSCSPDLQDGVDDNITGAPGFLNRTAGNYRLLSSSGCINAGGYEYNYWQPELDLDGNTRVIDFLPDMGAYEFQTVLDSDGDQMSDGYEMYYFGDKTSTPASDDGDSDGSDGLSEYIAGTDPTDPWSLFMINGAGNNHTNGFVIHWESKPGRSYTVRWADSLTNSFQTLETDIPYPQNCYTDTVHTAEDGGFYNLKVELE